MDWIFDNIQLLIIIGSSIAWWLTQQREQKGNDDDKPSPHERPGRQRIDWEQQGGGESDAARQVRERMRRLREQRGQGSAAPSAPPAPPRRSQPSVEDIPPVLRELMGIPDPTPEPPPVVVPPPVPQESHAERMARQMRELEAKQREAEALASRVRGQIGSGPERRRRRQPASTASERVDSLSDRSFLLTLRDARSARRAILLKEVLDRPVGLR